MNVNDGSEPCPACHNGIPAGTIKLHAEINRLRAENERLRAALSAIVEDAQDTGSADCRDTANSGARNESEPSQRTPEPGPCDAKLYGMPGALHTCALRHGHAGMHEDENKVSWEWPPNESDDAWRVLVNAYGEPYAVENSKQRRGVGTDLSVEPNRYRTPEAFPLVPWNPTCNDCGRGRYCCEEGARFVQDAWEEHLTRERGGNESAVSANRRLLDP